MATTYLWDEGQISTAVFRQANVGTAWLKNNLIIYFKAYYIGYSLFYQDSHIQFHLISSIFVSLSILLFYSILFLCAKSLFFYSNVIKGTPQCHSCMIKLGVSCKEFVNFVDLKTSAGENKNPTMTKVDN